MISVCPHDRPQEEYCAECDALRKRRNKRPSATFSEEIPASVRREVERYLRIWGAAIRDHGPSPIARLRRLSGENASGDTRARPQNADIVMMVMAQPGYGLAEPVLAHVYVYEQRIENFVPVAGAGSRWRELWEKGARRHGDEAAARVVLDMFRRQIAMVMVRADEACSVDGPRIEELGTESVVTWREKQQLELVRKRDKALREQKFDQAIRLEERRVRLLKESGLA